MTTKRVVAWFAALVALSFLSRWYAYEARADRCALDGNRIVPVYGVDLMAGSEVRASFCSIGCATEWPEVRNASDPPIWRVRDEISGEPLDATKACFVRSSVVTIPARQERTHAFRDWSDALEHLHEYGGERIVNPFAHARDGSLPELAPALAD